MKAMNEERRRLARDLRKLVRDVAEGKPVGAADVLDELGIGVEDHDIFPGRVEWLADLVDRPTCRIKVYVDGTCRCDSCGHEFSGGHGPISRFCPDCGRELAE